jgi:hypothetical protein
MHAGLADAETATALPAKGKFLPAAVAVLEGLAASSSFAGAAMFGVQFPASMIQAYN